MKKWIVSFSLLALCVGCQTIITTSSRIPLTPLKKLNVSQQLTVGTAKQLKPLADREARYWAKNASFVQLDAWTISYNGQNDHPFDAIWKFYYLSPTNQALVLAVVFNSRNSEVMVEEEPINHIFSDVTIGEAWQLDSPHVIKLAHERGIKWFPVQRMRLNYWGKTNCRFNTL